MLSHRGFLCFELPAYNINNTTFVQMLVFRKTFTCESFGWLLTSFEHLLNAVDVLLRYLWIDRTRFRFLG